MIILNLFVTAMLVGIALILLSNWLFFPKLRLVNDYKKNSWPSISVMIPARNEAAVITNTLQHLLKQDYPNFEILVLDDHSTDHTGMLVQAAAANAHNIRVINGKPLPEGWLGKSWACYQMAQYAHGDVFLFTDADVTWESGSLHTVVTELSKTRADLLSIWPTQVTKTWSERLCVPLMAMAVLGYLPILGVHHTSIPIFAAANGQCMVWKRTSYERLGGHSAVIGNVLEDVILARMVKSDGMCLRMADGNRFIRCRMYRNWPEVRDGYAKNVLAGYGGRVSLLVLATLFHWMLFIYPWLWLVYATHKSNTGQQLGTASLIVLGLAIRGHSAAYTHQRIRDALLMPLSVILMTHITAQALWWHYAKGGPSWKGRSIRTRSTSKQANEQP